MNPFVRILSAALMTAVLATSASADFVPTGKLPETVVPNHYQLDLRILPEQKRFSGQVAIDVSLIEETDVIWLHGRGLSVEKARITLSSGDTLPLEYIEFEDVGVAKVVSETPIPAGPATLEMSYSAPFNQSLEGLYSVRRGGQSFAFTQLQAVRARRVFPGFDEPRFKTPFDISLVVPENDAAISNAPEAEVRSLGDGTKRVTFQTTKPLPTYLLALAVGEFDIVEWEPLPSNDVRPWAVPLRGITPKGKGEQIHFALENTAPMIEMMEDYFGIPYPYAKLDLVAPVEFKVGGMENAGAIFYGQDRILFQDKPSVWQLQSFGYIHAHELSHSWFGDFVTPKWWDDLWLNEAFASWMSNKIAHQWRLDIFDDRSAIRQGNYAMVTDRQTGAKPIHRIVKDESDIQGAFDSVTYSKGNAVLSMIENFMGPEVFRDGVQQYLNAHPHGSAVAGDFIGALSEASGDDAILASINSFLEQPGIPRISQRLQCEDSGKASVHLKQDRSFPSGANGDAAQTWSIPLCLAYAENGHQARQCQTFDTSETTVKLDTKTCPEWVHPNAGGAAYLTFDMPEDEWDALIANFYKLPPTEALSVLYSIAEAYDAGTVSTELLLKAAAVSARSLDWDIVWALVQPVKEIKLFVIPQDMQPKFREILRAIYRPALDRFDVSPTNLAKDETEPFQAMLRSNIAWFMVVDAKDAQLRSILSDLGMKYAGYLQGEEIDPTAIHPDLVRLALVAATAENGVNFAKHLGQLLGKTDDNVLREHLIRALAYQEDPEIVAYVWDLILDPATSKLDASNLLRRQAQIVANRERILERLTQNYDAVLDRIPESHRRWMPWRAYSFCDEDGRNRTETFFASKVRDLPGGPETLQEVLEYIDICTAIAEKHREEAVRAISDWSAN